MDPPEQTSSATLPKPGKSDRGNGDLAAIIDHCSSAKMLADACGDRFLAYMLAMTIEEARGRLSAEMARSAS